jgi:hypothetical protein
MAKRSKGYEKIIPGEKSLLTIWTNVVCRETGNCHTRYQPYLNPVIGTSISSSALVSLPFLVLASWVFSHFFFL